MSRHTATFLNKPILDETAKTACPFATSSDGGDCKRSHGVLLPSNSFLATAHSIAKPCEPYKKVTACMPSVRPVWVKMLRRRTFCAAIPVNSPTWGRSDPPLRMSLPGSFCSYLREFCDGFWWWLAIALCDSLTQPFCCSFSYHFRAALVFLSKSPDYWSSESHSVNTISYSCPFSPMNLQCKVVLPWCVPGLFVKRICKTACSKTWYVWVVVMADAGFLSLNLTSHYSIPVVGCLWSRRLVLCRRIRLFLWWGPGRIDGNHLCR